MRCLDDLERAPHCSPGTGAVQVVSLACLADADCPANRLCMRYGCIDPRPGEACWTATPLVFTNGRAEAVADAVGYGCAPPRADDDGLPACSGGTVYFRFTLPVQSRVIFTMGWNPASYPPVLDLLANVCAWRDESLAPTSEMEMLIRWLPPGDYTVRVRTKRR